MRLSEVAGDVGWELPVLVPEETADAGSELVQRLRDGQLRGAPWVGIETDGARLVRDPGFALALRRLDAQVHLRIAGTSERVHLAVHGRDLRRLQRKALDTCAALGLNVALVMVVEEALNGAELGDVALLGLEHPAVHAAVFRPNRGQRPRPPAPAPTGGHAPGRSDPHGQPGQRRTARSAASSPIDDLLHALVRQLPGMLRADHFTATNGRRIAYLVCDGEDLLPINPARIEADPTTRPARPATTATPLAQTFTIVLEEAHAKR